jgi:hypothetical protein
LAEKRYLDAEDLRTVMSANAIKSDIVKNEADDDGPTP